MKSGLLLLCLMFLSGCATPYQSKSFRGGYSDTKIQDDIYKVSFRGNAYTSRERVEDLALLRCAEVVIENGYRYFTITKEEDKTETFTETTPVTATTQGGIVNTTPMGGKSSRFIAIPSAAYSSKTVYTGGQTRTFHKPRTYMTIKCFYEQPEGVATLVYDAKQVRANLRKQYNIR